MMVKQKRLKFVMEFPMETAIPGLYEKISTEYGLEKWFANKVLLEDNGIFTFVWNEITVHAKVDAKKKNTFVRFNILENSPDEYFELKILKNEITDDISLEITDFADYNELEDYKMLWSQQVKYLRELIEERNLV